MQKHRKMQLAAAIGLIAALAVGAFASTAFAAPASSSTRTPANLSVSKGNAAQVKYMGTVDLAKLPKESPSQVGKSRGTMPLLFPGGAKSQQQAQHSNRGSVAPHNAGFTPIKSGTSTAGGNFPSQFTAFNGMKDSGTICGYFGTGCQPPDMAVAANPAGGVLQAVNTSLAVYSNTGTIVAGPVSATTFFGVPNPTPANCQTTGTGPFLSDPRAYFDSFDNRFAVAFLEVEGAPGFGIDPNCNFVSAYWVGVSTSSNVAGSYRIYRINQAGVGTDALAAADYTQMGFNGDGIYWSANMFDSQSGAYQYAQVIGCGSKVNFYAGTAITCNAWFDFTAGSALLDTVNPVQTPMSADNSPHAEFFVSSFNGPDNTGANCTTQVCHGGTLWAWSDPGNTTGHGNLISGVIFSSNGYVEPPGADQPSCTGGAGCVESLDNRVSATPVYHAGHVFAAHVTGITNASSQFVPGVQWWDLVPALAPGYPTHITGVSTAQDAYLNASSGFTALTFPVVYPDLDNDLILGYDYMGDSIFPSINFTSRRVTDPPSTISGLGIIAKASTVSTGDGRWGDFEAMSYTAPYQDFIWFGSQYADSTTTDWDTWLVKFRFNIGG